MIDDFRFEYRWLSNFHLCEINYLGITYPSSEHAYQAAKFDDINIKMRFSSAINISCKEAKRLGRKTGIIDNWDDIKLDIMEQILRIKFSIPELSIELINTYPHQLIEGNSWNDTFWGVCNGVGENNLGKILMKLREDLIRDKILK